MAPGKLLFHLFFPVTDHIELRLVTKLLDRLDFFCGQLNFRCLHSILYLINFCHSDDRQRAFCNSPGNRNLCSRHMMAVSNLLQAGVQLLKLRKHRIVGSSPVRVFRERMLCIIFSGQRSLLQYHI